MTDAKRYPTLPVQAVPSTQYIPALTGLRAVAAYGVFVHHYNPAAPHTIRHALFAQGYIGVSVFFVLSGFVMYHRYAPAYLSGTGWSWLVYVRHRFARIYPLYALLLLLTGSVQAVVHQSMTMGVFWLNLTLAKGFFEAYTFSGIAQSWSLTVELCFYASAPLLFDGLQRWGVFRLTVMLSSIGLLAWLAVGTNVSLKELSFFAFYTFFGRGFEFILGMALARRWQAGLVPPFSRLWQTGLVIMSVCVGWQTSFIARAQSPIYLLGSEVLVYNGGLPISIYLLLAGLIHQKTSLSRLLASPVLQAAGRSSYAFYLIHIGVLANGLQRIGVTNHWLLFGALVGIAHGLHCWVEQPLCHLIRRAATR